MSELLHLFWYSIFFQGHLKGGNLFGSLNLIFSFILLTSFRVLLNLLIMKRPYPAAESFHVFIFGIWLSVLLIITTPSWSYAHGGGGMGSKSDTRESFSSPEDERRKAMIMEKLDNEKFSAEMSNTVMNMTREMQFQRASGSSERDFATLLILHNQGFIDLAEAELKYGKDSTLKVTTEKMISEKKKEIEVLKNWVKAH